MLHKFQPILYRIIKWHYRKPRIVKKRGLSIKLYPSVFHPSFYLSTDIFLDWILTLDLKDKSALELGAGNGFISLYLAKFEGLKMLASDINDIAVKGLKENAQRNEVLLEVYHSDLFKEIPQKPIDYIFINPPFYNKSVSSKEEYAFFCGADFEYFKAFFPQIKAYLAQSSQVWMILSNTAPEHKIEEIANENDILLESVFSKAKNSELFSIYKITAS